MAQHWTNFLGGTQEQLPTILFTLFVVFQLFNAFNSRELGNTSIFKNLLSNKLMLGVVAFTFALQVIITQFGGFFRYRAVIFHYVAEKIGLAASVVALSEIVKLIKYLLKKARK